MCQHVRDVSSARFLVGCFPLIPNPLLQNTSYIVEIILSRQVAAHTLTLHCIHYDFLRHLFIPRTWSSGWLESPVVIRSSSFIGICTLYIRHRISGLGYAAAGFTDGYGLRDSSVLQLAF
ncbi:conserved hypothetical protein [Trichinella spiralis]|uniref:hypothetical protein n=1 Tax=Trichinella spiralis TaxID=6334 RepID=UPI0001EFD1D9|nr:conserved hypothetical protein [Trichinella spiralis]